MTGAAQFFDILYYGYSRQMLYLRLDLSHNFLSEHDEFEVRMNASSKTHARVHATIAKGKLALVDFSRGDFPSERVHVKSDGQQIGFQRIFEVGLTHELLGVKMGDKVQVQVALWVNNLPVQIIPQEGWLSVELTEDFS